MIKLQDYKYVLSGLLSCPSERMLNSLAGFPASQLEARGGEGRTSPPAASSSPPDALPLCGTQIPTVADVFQKKNASQIIPNFKL